MFRAFADPTRRAPYRLERRVYAWRGGSEAVEGYGHRLDTVVTSYLTFRSRGTRRVPGAPGSSPAPAAGGARSGGRPGYVATDDDSRS